MNIIEKDDNYVAHTYGRYKVSLEKGNGSIVYDTEGNKYIDFGSGIGVTAFGFNDEN